MPNPDHSNESDVLFRLPKRQITVTPRTISAQTQWSSLLLTTGIAIAFGTSVPVGYNIGVINAPANYIRDWCNQTMVERYSVWMSDNELDILWATVVSIFLIGGCVGSLGGAWLADRLGRKPTMLVCAGLLTIGAAFMFFCRMLSSVEMLLIGRLIVGLASGLTTTVMAMYLMELAPIKLRGTMGVMCAMGVTGGVVVGQVGSLPMVLGSDALWHYGLSAYVLLVIACFTPYFWFPESPKYLYCVRGEKEMASNVLLRLRNHQYNMVNMEMETMEQEASTKIQTRSVVSVLRDPSLLLPIVLVCALQGGQQLSGINAVFYYSVSIFEKAGLTSEEAKWANLGAGCLNLATSFFSPLLMSKVNRRPLSMLSCFASGVCLSLLTAVVFNINQASWLPIACIVAVLAYIFFYQIGLGPVPYFIGSELFEMSSRPGGMALGSLASWLCNFLIGMTFPPLQRAWGAFVFLPFAIVCFGLVLLLKIYLPETRGKDASEVAPLVARGFKSRPTRLSH